MKKKISEKIRAMITRGLLRNHRGLFFLIGDRAKDQVINLFHLWQSIRQTVKGDNLAQPKILWCYKDDLGFSSHQKKRQRQVGKLMKQGLYEAEADTPFDLFLSSSDIRFCYYKEATKILGSSFDILVLQDFERLSANLLCQTIETVRGGGLVFVLLKGMDSLRQLYSMTMDVHSRYKTDKFSEVHPLFNERMLLSLCASPAAMFLDDELNLLRVSSSATADSELVDPENDELISLQNVSRQGLNDLLASVVANEPLSRLLSLAATLDQAKAVLSLVDSLTGKSARPGLETIFLTAGRGRGKSAALGLAIGAALMSGANSIHVTSAGNENLHTVFEFAVRALEALGFRRGADFATRQDADENPEEISLTLPSQPGALTSARPQVKKVAFRPADQSPPPNIDLLVIDEAAAVPLNVVRPMVLAAGCPVLISSTVHGYEGTGRSLSLKLIEELRLESRNTAARRQLREIELALPIRYALSDPVEAWLNSLLCLESVQAAPLRRTLPHPEACKLYLVSKPTLFSFHKSSEKFLSDLWSLFVSSHYKNSPNDLQLLCDAPGHFLAVLLGPVDTSGQKAGLPDILVALQCTFEGGISKETLKTHGGRGSKAAGDLIPWALAEQFLDDKVAEFTGVRVVRIATHPKAVKLGFGSKALQLLEDFFKGQSSQNPELIDMGELMGLYEAQDSQEAPSNLLEETIAPRKALPPLLKPCEEIKPLQVSYLSVSFGLTRSLYNFWAKNKYTPFYLKLTKNEITGEHNCMMIRQIDSQSLNFEFFTADFRRRLVRLLPLVLSDIEPALALAILEPNYTSLTEPRPQDVRNSLFLEFFSDLDIQRLQSYCRNLVEHYLVRDLIGRLAELFFLNHFPSECALSYSQALILLGIGLQGKSVEYFADTLKFSHAQVLSLFNKSIRRLFKYVSEIHSEKTGKEIGFVEEDEEEEKKVPKMEPLSRGIEELSDPLVKRAQPADKNSQKRAKVKTSN